MAVKGKKTSTDSTGFDFVIESGLEVPAPQGGGRLKYPTAMLEVGQSFFVPIKEDAEDEKTALNNVYSTLSQSGMNVRKKDPTKQFAVRKTENDGFKGCRIYRIK